MNEELYRENILDHYHHPHHYGVLKSFDFKLEGANQSCGDELTLYLKIDRQKKITAVGFTASACAIATASTSMLTDQLVGEPVAKITKIKPHVVERNLGVKLSPTRLKCALLPLSILQSEKL